MKQIVIVQHTKMFYFKIPCLDWALILIQYNIVM